MSGFGDRLHQRFADPILFSGGRHVPPDCIRP
jgi:hypothetical protein